MKQVHCRECNALTPNGVSRLCDTCLRQQGQMRIDDVIVQKIDRGTLSDGRFAARVLFEDNYVVVVGMKSLHGATDETITDYAVKARNDGKGKFLESSSN